MNVQGDPMKTFKEFLEAHTNQHTPATEPNNHVDDAQKAIRDRKADKRRREAEQSHRQQRANIT